MLYHTSMNIGVPHIGFYFYYHIRIQQDMANIQSCLGSVQSNQFHMLHPVSIPEMDNNFRSDIEHSCRHCQNMCQVDKDKDHYHWGKPNPVYILLEQPQLGQ